MLRRTDAVVREVNDIILKTPGVEHTSPVTGFDVTTNTVAPNAATIFFSLPSLYGHEIPGVNAATSLASAHKYLRSCDLCKELGFFVRARIIGLGAGSAS